MYGWVGFFDSPRPWSMMNRSLRVPETQFVLYHAAALYS